MRHMSTQNECMNVQFLSSVRDPSLTPRAETYGSFGRTTATHCGSTLDLGLGAGSGVAIVQNFNEKNYSSNCISSSVKIIIGFSLNVFTEFSAFSDKNICHYSKRVQTCHLMFD